MRDEYYALKDHDHFNPGGCFLTLVILFLVVAEATGHLRFAPDAPTHFQQWLHSWVIWK